MISTSYTYYHTTYGGELSETEFNKYYKKAQYKLDNITNGLFGQADEQHATQTMLTDVRELTCNVIDKLSAIDEAQADFGETLGIKSIKVGSVSKTFAGTSAGEKASSTDATLNGNIRDIVIEYCGKYGWGCRWV